METTIVYWGYIGNNGKENGNYYSMLGGILGIMEKKMETTIVCWGYIGNNGKENGNYYSISGLYWE